jgi:hypothetical protein
VTVTGSSSAAATWTATTSSSSTHPTRLMPGRLPA